MNYFFGKSFRLRKTPEFQRVFEARQRAVDDVLIVFAIPSRSNQSRLGLSVSRKVGGAVVRNRWKRLIREAFRRHQASFFVPMDVVVLPQRGAVPPNQNVVDQSFVKLIERINRRFSPGVLDAGRTRK